MIIRLIGKPNLYIGYDADMLTPTRPEVTFLGLNHVHFGPKYLNYVTFPVIPLKEG
jgi:hypothetical protein